MTDLEKRIENIISPLGTIVINSSVYASKQAVIKALCKNAKIGYGVDYDLGDMSFIKTEIDTHSAIILDIQEIQPEDTPQKLIEDILKLVDRSLGFHDRAKRLVERESK